MILDRLYADQNCLTGNALPKIKADWSCSSPKQCTEETPMQLLNHYYRLYLKRVLQTHPMLGLLGNCFMALSMACFVGFQLQIPWLACIVLIAGALIAVMVLKYKQSLAKQKVITSALSRGSICIWQMDREA